MKQSNAAQRFVVMRQNFDSSALIAFAVRDGYAPDAQSAKENLDGVMQWLAGHAVDRHADYAYVMMNGPVDEMYHAFMLNTRMYLHFCRDYIGFFVHHTPLDDSSIHSETIMDGVGETLSYLRNAFGDDLSPSLQNWINSHARGELSASSVSCVGNGRDSTPENLLGISDFASFFDRNAHTPVGTA